MEFLKSLTYRKMESTDIDIIIDNEHARRSDAELFFSQSPDEVIWLEEKKDMWDILVMSGIFSSRSQARKDGRAQEIPLGWTDVRMGKKKRRFCILNAIGE